MKNKMPSLPAVGAANLGTLLAQTVRGQPEVVASLAATIQRRESGVLPPDGVRGAFIFAGPTGVGKTLLAKTLAELVFGGSRLERFDCSEFKTLSSYESHFGNRNGDIGRIGQAHQRVANGVWLFDEIEKAHPEFVHLFLQATDAARLTLASGRALDLSGLYIILTTNLGSAAIIGREHLPFASLEAHVVRAIEKWLKPELRGRFETFVFRPLNREAQLEIAEMHITQIFEWNQKQGRRLTAGPDVAPFLLRRGYSARLGARPLKRTIDHLVGNAIVKELQAGGSGSGTLTVHGDELILADSNHTL